MKKIKAKTATVDNIYAEKHGTTNIYIYMYMFASWKLFYTIFFLQSGGVMASGGDQRINTLEKENKDLKKSK